MTRPTAVLTPKSRPKAATLSEARRVRGTAGAALLATSGSAIGPLSAGPRLLAQAGPAEYLAHPPRFRAVPRRRARTRRPGRTRPAGDCAAGRARCPGRRREQEGGARRPEAGPLPHDPAPSVEPAERAGVRLRQGAHKVVDGAGGLIPHDQA